MSILGVGVDIVEISAFTEQLSLPGTRFTDAFTVLELSAVEKAKSRITTVDTANTNAESLAARWAAKEAFIKAWSNAMFGKPPVFASEETNWQEIEVIQDIWQRTNIRLSGKIAKSVAETIGEINIHTSLSHDGNNAIAYVILEAVYSS